MLESGEYGSVKDLAEAVNINRSSLSRVLRLTLLAPDIVEAILDERQPKGLGLAELLRDVPLDWNEQRKLLGTSGFTRDACWRRRAQSRI